MGGRGGGGVKELLGFFINHVFQYDSGTPKRALELKKGLAFFGFCPKILICLWFGTQGARDKIQGFKYFS